MVTIPPRLTTFIAEADALAPHRRGWDGINSSDGNYVDKPGDHNVDSRGVCHAQDLGQSMPGTAYWEPRFDQFDVWRHCYDIAHAYQAATPTERQRRWRWLYDGGYMVWFDGTKDIIFNPSVSLLIRQNGAFKTDHFQHAHFSIGHTVPSENDTQPIFGSTEDDDMPLSDPDIARLKRELAPVIEAAAAKAIKSQFYALKDGVKVDALLIDRLRANTD